MFIRMSTLCVIIFATLLLGISPVFAGNITHQGKIGVIAPLTGDASQSGITAKTGIELAQQDFQSVHPDTSLELVIEDSQSDPSRAAEIVKKFYDQGIRIIIASGSSAEVLAIKPFTDANGMTVIAPMSTAPSLALVDSIIRLTPNDLFHANALAEYLRFRGVEAVAPLYRNDVFGVEFFTEFKTQFEAKGGSVTAGVGYDTATSDFSSSITELTTQVQSAKLIHSASTVAVLTVAFGEIHSIFTAASRQPVLSSVNWYGTEDYARDARIDNDAVARSFALSVQFTSSIYSRHAVIHPYASFVPFYENLVTRALKVNSTLSQPCLGVMFDSLWLAGFMVRDPNLMNVQTFVNNPPNYFGYTNRAVLDKNGDWSKGYYSYFRYVEVNNTPAWALVGSFWPTDLISHPRVSYREFIPDGKDKLIRVGLLFSLTGNNAVTGNRFTQMAELAKEDINAFLQRKYKANSKIEYVIADTQSDPDVALTKLKELKQNGIQLVVGPMTSGELEKVSDFANQNDMILISPSSTAVSLAKNDNLFRLSLDDSKQAKALATLLYKDGYRNVEVLYRNDTYGAGLFSLFSKLFTEMGGRCGSGVSYDTATKQFDGTIKALEAQGTESLKTFAPQKTAVLMISFGEGVSILESLESSKSSLADLHWVGTDGILTNSSLLNSSAATEMAIKTKLTVSTFGMKLDYEISFSKAFAKAIFQKFGYEPTAFDISVYDAIWLFTQLAENQDWQWEAPFNKLRSGLITLANNSNGYRSFNILNQYGDSVYGSIDFNRINFTADHTEWDIFASYLFLDKERFIYFNQSGDSSAGEWSLYQ